jgi:sterol desaturase/sphingolipid hydroxylase (fatty acid hydroxylase superfamily)
MGVGNVVVAAAVHGATLGLYFWLYERRVFELGSGASAWVLLFFAEDFTYYWWHRASHEVRLLWAPHENHHSSEYFNYSTALRQSYTTPFTVPLFYWWLPLAGFHPLMIFTQISLSLLYQFWIHTELVGRMPRAFEAVFNTKNIHTWNPLRIAFHEWASMLRDAAHARGWRDRIGYLLAAPGWSPDGSTLTAKQLRG